jgi:DNA polymerase III epsilon subunit-like protein
MNAHSEWVVLDTETSGLDYPIFVVEIAAQRMCGSAPFGEPFRVFLNHDIDIPMPAEAVHGYTKDYLAEVGIAPEAAYKELRDYVGERPIVAHFLRYDWTSALLPEWRRLQLAPISSPGFCSWMLAKRSVPSLSSYSLESLRNHFGVSSDGAHSAIGDVRAVVEILSKFILPRLHACGFDRYEQFRDFATWKPLLRCHCLVEGKDFEEEFARLQKQKRLNAETMHTALHERRAADELRESIFCGMMEIPEILRRFVAEEPGIIFSGKKFMFTGGLSWGSRSKIAHWVEKAGGSVATSKAVNKSIDYLVLGEDSKLGWQIKGGPKLSQAIYLQTLGQTATIIIRESDFIDQLTMVLAIMPNK